MSEPGRSLTTSLAFRTVRASLLTAVLAASTLASATPVVWTLDNVTLTDGQGLTGAFTYDTASGQFSAIAVANSGAAALPPALWDTEFMFSPPVPGRSPVAVFLMSGPASQTNTVLSLLWNQYGQQQGLTDAGGVVELRTAGPPGSPNSSVFLTCGTLLDRTVEFPVFVALPSCENADALQGDGAPYVTGGTLSAVPVPAAAWLFVTSIAALGSCRRLRGTAR